MPNLRQGEGKILNRHNQCIEAKNEIIAQFATPEEKHLLKKQIKCVYYKKGEMIFYEHQPVYLVYFIFEGQVKLWKEGIHNEEQIVHFAQTGGIIGFWGCLHEKEYTLSATAMETTRVCFINKDSFFRIIQANHKLLFELLKHYTKVLKLTEVHLRNMSEMNVREKLAHAILYLAEFFGTKENSNYLSVELSRNLLSGFAGVSPDRVSKQLTEFKEEDLIQVNKKERHVH